MTTQTRATRRRWWVPAGLVLLSAVPALAGMLRLTQLSSGGPVTAESARYFATPAPVVLHIIGATVYCVVGAFQFVPGLRARPWHRLAGRVLVPCGLVAVLSGLWMDLLYPRPSGDGALLSVLRLGFGSFMVLALVLGVVAIRRRDVRTHRAWMTRAYAIGAGAGTQGVVTGLWVAVDGVPHGTTRALLLGAGWAINLAVAEHLLRAPARGKVSR